MEQVPTMTTQVMRGWRLRACIYLLGVGSAQQTGHGKLVGVLAVGRDRGVGRPPQQLTHRRGSECLARQGFLLSGDRGVHVRSMVMGNH